MLAPVSPVVVGRRMGGHGLPRRDANRRSCKIVKPKIAPYAPLFLRRYSGVVGALPTGDRYPMSTVSRLNRICRCWGSTPSSGARRRRVRLDTVDTGHGSASKSAPRPVPHDDARSAAMSSCAPARQEPFLASSCRGGTPALRHEPSFPHPPELPGVADRFT